MRNILPEKKHLHFSVRLIQSGITGEEMAGREEIETATQKKRI